MMGGGKPGTRFRTNIDGARELGYNRPEEEAMADQSYREQQMGLAPKVVAIGGGTGLSTLLRGLKTYTTHLTAIVTVADDGGSSGRLRRELGMLPPGDFRNCIAALADDEALITQLFQYRFGHGNDLNGHSFGNLFITALTAVTGSFERAILETGRVLAVRGRVLPSTLEDVTLVASVLGPGCSEEGILPLTQVVGESAITQCGRPVERVFLQPERVRAYPEAVRAILQADLIIAGPGSLFTSILPNLLVGDIRRAVEVSAALKLYVCNVATQHGETDGFDVGQHADALQCHTAQGLFPLVLANSAPNQSKEYPKVPMVELRYPPDAGYEVIEAPMIDPEVPWRHEAQELARQIMAWYARQRGTRSD
jgi:uncharacterized cofD-like protein